MIVVDSSVWIGDLRNDDTAAVRKLRAPDLAVEAIVVPDPVLPEVLRGARNDRIGGLAVQGLLSPSWPGGSPGHLRFDSGG